MFQADAFCGASSTAFSARSAARADCPVASSIGISAINGAADLPFSARASSKL